MGAPRSTGWGPLLVLAVIGALTLAMLQLSHVRERRQLGRTLSAVESLARARVALMRAHVVWDGAASGDPTYNPLEASAEAQNALDALSGWMQGRGTRLGIDAEPPSDPRLRELAGRYADLADAYRLDLLERTERTERTDRVAERIRFSRLESAATALEARVFDKLRSELRQAERVHWISLGLWFAFLALTGLLLSVARRHRTRAEAARLATEARYAQLDSLAPVGILRCAASGELAEANRWWREMTGRDARGWRGRPWWEAVAQEDRERVQAIWMSRTGRGRPFTIETRLRFEEGLTWVLARWYEDENASPEEGAATWIGTFVDESDRHEAEERLRQAQKLEAIGQLTGGIAHDFNNLLTVILANAILVQDMARLDPEARAALEDLEAAARSGVDLVGGLTGFSRRSELHFRSLPLGDLVRDASRLLERLLPSAVQLVVDTRGDGPETWGDPAALQQVLLNLATNARDAMPEGGRMVIRVDSARLDAADLDTHPGLEPGSYGCISISDTGSGMDRETAERIFEPFYTTKSEGRGTGLGLARVHGIVRQHGGQVYVYSELGRGTTFRIYLPAISAPGPASPDEPRGAPLLPARDATDGRIDGEPAAATAGVGGAGSNRPPQVGAGRHTVVVVDDDDSVRRIAARALRREGYEVIEAADGAEALEELREKPEIELVLTDLSMKDVGGLELYRRVTRTLPDPPAFLFTSGYAAEDLQARRELPDGASFVAKPWTVESLSRAVRTALEGGNGDSTG